MEREKDYIYLDINEGNRQIQKSRRITNTIHCTNYSIYLFSISGFVSEYKLMYSILYTGFLFTVLICFCIYAEEFIEKANKINFNNDGKKL